MIYLEVRGRIGNQLFMFATAYMIQKLKGGKDTIVIDAVDNGSFSEGLVYENSLVNYNLPNVKYLSTIRERHRPLYAYLIKKRQLIELIEPDNLNDRYNFAIKHQKLYNFLGLYHIQDGYAPFPKRFRKNIHVSGYFQSDKFFKEARQEILYLYNIDEIIDKSNYPHLDEIKNRNTVCISIKVQHNAGNPMYDVCHESYYEKAIKYMTDHVENPLFFICSDNVEYVKEHLIDTSKYDVVCQVGNFPVHISLGVMSKCKHFIIGNTSFGWWAQYLSSFAEKIVIAPTRWYNIEDKWQYDIYQDNWVTMED